MTDFEEAEDFMVHGFAVRCTATQQREIQRRVRGSVEYQAWHALDSVMRTHHSCADTVEVFASQVSAATRTAEALAQADAKVARVVLVAIAEVLG